MKKGKKQAIKFKEKSFIYLMVGITFLTVMFGMRAQDFERYQPKRFNYAPRNIPQEEQRRQEYRQPYQQPQPEYSQQQPQGGYGYERQQQLSPNLDNKDVSAPWLQPQQQNNAAQQTYQYEPPPQRDLPPPVYNPPAPRNNPRIKKATSILGLIFSKNGSVVSPNLKRTTRGIITIDLPLTEGSTDFEATMSGFLGRALNIESIRDIKNAISRFYQQKNHPFIFVRIEPEITNGVLHFVIIESVLGKVRVDNVRTSKYEPKEGWYKNAIFLSAMKNKAGQRINTKTTIMDLSWLNNPYRQVSAVYEAGEKTYTTDIVLRVNDIFPFRPYLGFENSGSKALGEGRFFAGFSYGNLWGIDHILDYQVTTGGDFDFGKMTSHSGSYTIPLPWRHKLTLSGSLGSTNVPFGITNVVSNSYAFSIRNSFDFPPIFREKWVHGGSVGYQFKEFGNYIEFGDVKVPTTAAATYDESQLWQVGQLTAEYHGAMADPQGSTDFSLGLTWSPGGLAPNSTTQLLRESGNTPEGTADYWYMRFHIGRSQVLPANLSFYAQLTYQYAPQVLPPSERYGLGGFGSVRGFIDRTSNTEESFNFSLELRSMPLTPLKWFGVEKIVDTLTFVGFFDYGMGKTNLIGSETGESSYLSSMGFGLRYNLSPYFQARLDSAWKLDNNLGEKTGEIGTQYSITLSYVF